MGVQGMAAGQASLRGVNGHRERDPRAVAHCTGGPRPRKRGPEDLALYKGRSQAAGCELLFLSRGNLITISGLAARVAVVDGGRGRLAAQCAPRADSQGPNTLYRQGAVE